MRVLLYPANGLSVSRFGAGHKTDNTQMKGDTSECVSATSDGACVRVTYSDGRCDARMTMPDGRRVENVLVSPRRIVAVSDRSICAWTIDADYAYAVMLRAEIDATEFVDQSTVFVCTRDGVAMHMCVETGKLSLVE